MMSVMVKSVKRRLRGGVMVEVLNVIKERVLEQCQHFTASSISHYGTLCDLPNVACLGLFSCVHFSEEEK